jgi:hypothetical protein
MDIKAIAEVFHNNDKTIYSMLYHGRLALPYYKIGRKIFVDTEDVATFIQAKKKVNGNG